MKIFKYFIVNKLIENNFFNYNYLIEKNNVLNN